MKCDRCEADGAKSVKTKSVDLNLCDKCLKLLAREANEARSRRAMEQGGCLKCGRRHEVCGKEKYVGGFCTECAVAELEAFDKRMS